MEKKLKFANKKNIILLIVLVLVVVLCMMFIPKMMIMVNGEPEIITVSRLEKIIDTSVLSSFQAVYNGCVEIMNEKKPEQIDFYVSYEAKISAGFNLKAVKFDLDNKAKLIKVKMPKIDFTDVNVDIASLDYIKINNKADESKISAKAYKVCIEDATNESRKEDVILDLAKQNAENMMKALINPFISQLDSNYKLEITFGGEYDE